MRNTKIKKVVVILVEQDTIRLLRECDAGIKMGVSSIEDVVEYAGDDLRKLLTDSRAEHDKLDREIQQLLDKYNDDGKEPNVMAKSMSWIKTNVMLSLNESDATIADLMTDGCNMGVKYLNKYEAADEVSKDIAKRLINLEEKLAVDIRQYL